MAMSLVVNFLAHPVLRDIPHEEASGYFEHVNVTLRFTLI